ncbi:hypothetical protein DL93DRAFT_2170204 [Clavulina sp. PMI_390]|nr:hypothetical protein DL93DRAFT_2170204 [Clavulina sp. PMI_390]
MASEETPTNELIRDVKARVADLQKTLKDPAAKPWDRQVEIQRQNLRKPLLSAVFKAPDEAVSIKLAGKLWAETTYALIDRYRKLIAEMEAKIASSANEPPPPSNQHQRGNGRRQRAHLGDSDGAHGGKHNPLDVGPVALRKLLKRFTTFLTEEDRFWKQLFLRFSRAFKMPEADVAIEALAMLATDPDDLLRNSHAATAGGDEDEGPILLSETEGDSRAPPAQGEVTSEVREHRLLQLSKCLISLGDLARYRALAKEAPSPQVRRGRGGKASRGGRGGPPPTSTSTDPIRDRETDFALATSYYHHAHYLLPSDGNASNQLAILAMYSDDHFSATMRYYRAVCVERDFPTSLGNLKRSLAKILEKMETEKTAREATISGNDDAVNRLKREILEMHALWHLKPRAKEHSSHVLSQLHTHISSRALSSEFIIHTFVMALGALHVLSTSNVTPDGSIAPGVPLVRAHLLGLLQVLISVGNEEIQEALRSSSRESTAGNLAGFITASWRRTLPALRIASHWFVQARTTLVPDRTFWDTYAKFGTLLKQVFPEDKLPTEEIPLDEDLDLRGFLPLELDGGAHTQSSQVTGLQQESSSPARMPMFKRSDSTMFHPNEEHLIRLRDVQREMKLLVSSGDTPLGLAKERFVVEHPTVVARTIKRSDTLTSTNTSEVDDDARTISTTTDDPVRAAMNATLDEDDDDDEEQILYPRMGFEATKLVPPVTVTPHVAPIALVGNSPSAFPPPLSSLSTSPSSHHVASLVASPINIPSPNITTAEDLLSRVLGRGSPSLSPSLAPGSLARLRTNSTGDASVPFASSPLATHPFLQETPAYQPMLVHDQYPQPSFNRAPGVPTHRSNVASINSATSMSGYNLSSSPSHLSYHHSRTNSFSKNPSTVLPPPQSHLAQGGLYPNHEPLPDVPSTSSNKYFLSSGLSNEVGSVPPLGSVSPRSNPLGAIGSAVPSSSPPLSTSVIGNQRAHDVATPPRSIPGSWNAATLFDSIYSAPPRQYPTPVSPTYKQPPVYQTAQYPSQAATPTRGSAQTITSQYAQPPTMINSTLNHLIPGAAKAGYGQSGAGVGGPAGWS